MFGGAEHLWNNSLLATMIIRLIVVFIGCLLLLIGVAFITLFERLVLALRQLRKGPNKVGIIGIVQPLVDGIKLLLKSQILPSQAVSFLFLTGARWTLLLIIIIWSCVKTVPYHSYFWLTRGFLILLLGFGVYGIFLSGLRRISKYGLLGRLRGCIQRISYEVSFALIILSLIIFEQRGGFNNWSALLFWRGIPLWFISYTAETNRAPIDFAEGERELIRGLNIEYRSFPFAFIFVGEYGIVLCFSWLSGQILLGGSLLIIFICILVRLGIRRVLPRFRYDKLLAFCWTRLLPAAAALAFIRFAGRRI